MTSQDAGEQLELLRATVRGRRPRAPAPPAERDPVASVALDVPLPHLDRPFDYTVPATMAEAAVPGARVSVRFAGQDADGFVLARLAQSEHPGRLTPLRRVVSAEPVLTADVLDLCRAVAQRCAGSLADVLRLAVPPRHAATEAAVPGPVADVADGGEAADGGDAGDAGDAGDPRLGHQAAVPVDPGPWAAYRGGVAFLQRLRDRDAPRAVWTALPGRGQDDWPHALAVAASATSAGGRGSLLVVPDHKDVDRLDAALTCVLGPGRHVRLTADSGPAARYEAFLRVLRGHARVVVGTRAAAFAPVRDLGLAVCWDDGDELLAEPRAPYPHAREVLALRSQQAGAAFLVGSASRTAEAQQLVASGWARELVADRGTVRRRAPRVVVSGDDELRDPAARSARVPSLALRTAREALAHGPVLVQVPRAGYVPVLACGRCRRAARCGTCSGPLGLAGRQGRPTCRWCGAVAAGWSCADCHATTLRSVVVGAARTAEELGRSFPGTTVRSSGGPVPVVPVLDDRPRLVVATPGAEPVADGGYAAALLLDTWDLLGRPDLRAGEEALRRWLSAASLVRGAQDGGRVVVVGEAALAPLQALVRWDGPGHAARELAERTQLRLPPAVVLAEVTGTPQGVRVLLAALRLPPGADVLGPVRVEGPASQGAAGPAPETVRALVRAPREATEALGQALQAARAVVSAARSAPVPRVRVDPRDVG
ncbi:primosomal protein N' [Thalassiella azotivora]